jgi:hypothetical protein
MSENTELAEKLAKVFADNDLRWKIGGSKKVPTTDDIEAVLDRAKFEVEYQQVNSHLGNTQVVMNHLTFTLTENGKVAVLVKIGEIE